MDTDKKSSGLRADSGAVAGEAPSMSCFDSRLACLEARDIWFRDRVTSLEQQRDDLLAALRNIAAISGGAVSDIAVAAIARAE